MEEKKPENANQNCPGVNSQNAGKESSCEGCPNQQKCLSGEANKPDPNLLIIKNKLKNVKNIILILSGKGGVGKSTFSSQLSLILAKKGFEVGLLDIDICGPSIPRMMGLEGQEVHSSKQGWSPVYVSETLGVMSVGFMLPNKDDAVIWRGPRKNGLIQQFLTDVCWVEDDDHYLDFLVIDTPPGTTDEHISIVQYLSSCDNVQAIIVTTPQEVSLQDVRKELSFCIKTKTKILGVVENMSGFVCPNCLCESKIFPPISGGAEKMCLDYKIDLLGQIPLEPQVLLSAEKGKCIADECPNSVAFQIYNQIVEKITRSLNIKAVKE